MPDLSMEVYYHCQSAEYWETLLPSSGGQTAYTVRWDSSHHHNRERVEYDYSCTCHAYQYGQGRYCKHIRQAQESGKHCNWMQVLNGEPPARDANDAPCCPRCGGPVHALRYGV